MNSRHFLIPICVVAVLVFSALPGATAEKATKEECITMVKNALVMVEKEGLDAVVPRVNDKKGPFVWKDAYVCLLDTREAIVLAHPYVPRDRIGMSLINVKDVQGKAYFRDIMEVGNAKGQGWVDYIFMDNEERAREKISYVQKSEKANVIALAGIYTDKVVGSPSYHFPEMALPDIKGKKVALIIANKGFADNEFRVPKSMIEQAGGQTAVFSLSKGTARGMYGLTADVSRSLDDLKVPDFDAIIFVGGTGSRVYHENPTAHQIAREAVKNNKVLAAICWAPVILANAKVIQGKMVTVNPYEEKRFQKEPCFYTGDKVTVDGKIITANGPEASALFGKAIIETLHLL